MSDLVAKLINDNLVPLKPYESARRLFSGGQDWLNANESPFANAYTIDYGNFNRYPDCQPPALIERYSEYAGVTKEQCIVTRGADEGIELLIRTFCTPGKDNILICPPTYGMYAISAETCDVGVKKVPLLDNFNLNVDAICQTDDVNLIFICSPNNPTGTSVKSDDLVRILNHFSESALVVVDEAYIEFDKENTWSTEFAHHKNLVVLRTLSKAFALAGLRCGFTLANENIIRSLLKVIAPYPIPEPVAQIAAQALSEENLVRLESQIAELAALRTHLATQLNEFNGIHLVGDTRANFVLFRCAQSKALMNFLVAEGMLIRDQSKQLNLANCLRVSVGNEQQNQRLIALMQSFFEQNGASV